MSNEKQRLDVLLVERGLAPTRSKAKEMVENGLVSASCGGKLLKASQNVPADIELIVEQQEQWVSRAALKLKHALEFWKISPENKTCLDLGASTGGFTEVLLKNSASKVFAVDVGHGQFKLNSDKVILLEKTNSKDLSKSLISDPIDLIVCDVSFISLEKALPAALLLGKELVALIKPQFEVGKENIGRGVVSDPELQKQVCDKISDWLTGQNWLVLGITDSPITGGDGNKEFLIYARKQ